MSLATPPVRPNIQPPQQRNSSGDWRAQYTEIINKPLAGNITPQKIVEGGSALGVIYCAVRNLFQPSESLGGQIKNWTLPTILGILPFASRWLTKENPLPRIKPPQIQAQPTIQPEPTPVTNLQSIAGNLGGTGNILSLPQSQVSESSKVNEQPLSGKVIFPRVIAINIFENIFSKITKKTEDLPKIDYSAFIVENLYDIGFTDKYPELKRFLEDLGLKTVTETARDGRGKVEYFQTDDSLNISFEDSKVYGLRLVMNEDFKRKRFSGNTELQFQLVVKEAKTPDSAFQVVEKKLPTSDRGDKKGVTFQELNFNGVWFDFETVSLSDEQKNYIFPRGIRSTIKTFATAQ